MLTQGKQKIRVSYLRSAGIQNMWQLSKLSRQQIEDLDGIGAQGATAIYDLTKQIVKNAKEKLSVRIGIDSPTKADDALVAALYCVIVHGQQRQQLQGLYDRHHKPLTKEIATAQTTTSGFSWFFASAKERDSALTAATALQDRLDSEFGDLSLLEAYEAVSKADITECYAHFRAHAADYYATLEKHCTQLTLAQDTKAGLPEEMVAQIEAMELDLSGLKATLRNYQDFGVRYAVHQKRTLLGDEMGLGKTIQAIARAYRMGQTRDVLVYRLLADETIDERMLEILSAKQKEFDAFAEDSVIGDLQMQSDTSWLTKLVQEEQSRLGQQ
jgi:SNF2 family DNA or RNA helicase